MGLRQEEEIKLAIASIFGEENEGMLCCTLEAENADGQDVSIQVMQDAINISPYPFKDDPLERLEASGILEALDEPELETVDWDANIFATIGTGDLDISEVAELVDLVFVKLLSCESATYDIKVTTDDMA